MARRKQRFEVVRHRITIPSLDTRIKLVPFSDVHRHHPACDVERWKHFLERCRKDDDEYTLYLSLGDLDDLCSDSERKILNDDELHESTKYNLDQYAAAQTLRLADELRFMKGRLIGMVSGNHLWDFDQQGQWAREGIFTTTDLLCRELQTKWLGSLAFIRVSVKVANRGGRHSIDIVAAHGKAGGKLVGTSINQVKDLKEIFPTADVYCQGHDHQKGCWPITCLEVTNQMTVKQKRQWLCRTGSFLRGYVPGCDSYVVGRLYRPTDLGVIRGEIDFRRDKEGGADSIVKDIHFWS
jgi:hypothetical protein